MLTYLDNIYSVGENSPKAQNARRNNSKIQIGLNDNLARELMELHTISPAAGYTEVDIREAAKILSGWGIIFNKPIKGKGNWNGTTDYENIYVPSHAEPGNKQFLVNGFHREKGTTQAGKLFFRNAQRPVPSSAESCVCISSVTRQVLMICVMLNKHGRQPKR